MFAPHFRQQVLTSLVLALFVLAFSSSRRMPVAIIVFMFGVITTVRSHARHAAFGVRHPALGAWSRCAAPATMR